MRFIVRGPLDDGDYEVWDTLINECVATFHNPIRVPEMLTARYYASEYAAERNRIHQLNVSNK